MEMCPIDSKSEAISLTLFFLTFTLRKSIWYFRHTLMSIFDFALIGLTEI